MLHSWWFFATIFDSQGIHRVARLFKTVVEICFSFEAFIYFLVHSYNIRTRFVLDRSNILPHSYGFVVGLRIVKRHSHTVTNGCYEPKAAIPYLRDAWYSSASGYASVRAIFRSPKKLPGLFHMSAPCAWACPRPRRFPRRAKNRRHGQLKEAKYS